MIVDQTGCLHEGVYDSGTYEGEAEFFQIFRESIGQGRCGRNLPYGLPMILQWTTVDVMPEEAVERAELAFQFEEGTCVADDRPDLEPVSDNGRVLHQALDVVFVHGRDTNRVKVMERRFVTGLFSEDGYP